MLPGASILLVCALALAGLALPAWAWGRDGHMIVATVAQTQLHPAVRAYLCTILPPFTAYQSSYPHTGAPHKQYVMPPRHRSPRPSHTRLTRASCHLAPLAPWPDTIHGWAPWSSSLHYINPTQDAPPAVCEYGEHGFVNPRNIVTALYNYTAVLADPSSPSPSPPGEEPSVPFPATRDFALRMVTHLVGDMSQPFHLTGRARGGNDIWVQFEGRKARLHSVWDSQILLSQIRSVGNYTTPLRSPRIESALRGSTYDAYVRWVLHEGLGQPAFANQPSPPAWWDEKAQDKWVACPLPSLAGGSQRAVGQLPLAASPKWTVGEGEDTICALGWTWESHPLVCKYGFADPVPAAVALASSGGEDWDMLFEDEDQQDDERNGHHGHNEADAARRRRRRRRGRPSPTSRPGPRPSPPPLPELAGEYLDKINGYVTATDMSAALPCTLLTVHERLQLTSSSF